MKFKKIPSDYSTFITDKLTRLKPAKIRFKILFDDIINKFYLENNISSLGELERADIAVEIINSSFPSHDNDKLINKLLVELENKYFYGDETSLNYLSREIHLISVLNSVNISDNLPKNVIWLTTVNKFINCNPLHLRDKYELLYPIEGIILCEGQTEYTLLGNIFSLYNVNLDKLGYTVIPAGGKNQVARKYYELIEYFKLPIYTLLDNDANEVKELIYSKIREIDKLHLINSGEFEDLIPKQILLNTLNNVHKNDYTALLSDFREDIPMSHNLDIIYKKYGWGEFKKAQFAKELCDYISKNCTSSDFINSEIPQIISQFFPG